MYLEAELLFFISVGWRVKHLLLTKTSTTGNIQYSAKSWSILYNTHGKHRAVLENNITPQITCSQQNHGHKPTYTNPPTPCTAWGPRVRLEPVIWLASDFSPLSLTQHGGFHYHFLVCLWRVRTKTVITRDRTKTAPFPVWWARSQERAGQTVNRELMPALQLTGRSRFESCFWFMGGLHYDISYIIYLILLYSKHNWVTVTKYWSWAGKCLCDFCKNVPKEEEIYVKHLEKQKCTLTCYYATAEVELLLLFL